MITCKFFMQGTCKYGDNCKYSHQINDTTQNHGTSIMRQTTKPPQIDTNLLIKSVVNDMTNAEKGGHWLLSWYAPFKDKPCFPGFENRSFEEVRYGYYEAMKNGTVEQYKQQLQLALQEAVMKMKTLQNPSSDIVSMLVQIYNTPTSNQISSPVLFNSIPTNPVFAQNQPNSAVNNPQGTSIFALANQELFGKVGTNQQQSLFAAQPTGANLFPGTTPQNTNQNLFGGNQSIFVKPQMFTGNANNPIFPSQSFTPTTQNNPFGGQTNTFQATPNSIFGQTNNSFNTNNAFTSPLKTSPFQNQPVGNSPFSSPPPTTSLQPQASLFQNQPTTNKPFGNLTQPVINSVIPSPNPPTSSPVFSPLAQSFNFAQAAAANLPPTSFIPTIPSTNIFAKSTISPVSQNASPFQQPPTNAGNSIFNTSPVNPNIFGGQSPMFSNPLTTPQQNNPPPSIFAQAVPVNMFGEKAEIIDSNAYSKLEELSESEIKSFQNECFEFGKIPEKPPTAQMCD